MPKPRGLPCVNAYNGKTSYLLVKSKQRLPNVANPASPQLGEIIGAIVKDVDNGFFFTPTVLTQINSPPNNGKRLAIKIISNQPVGGGDILDGILTITLQIFTGTGLPPDVVEVTDVPVDYIDDPSGP